MTGAIVVLGGVQSGWLAQLRLALPLLFVGAGLLADLHRPGHPAARLVIWFGLAEFLHGLVLTRVPLLWTFGALFESTALAFLLHLFLAYPSGRVVGTVRRRLLWVIYPFAVTQVAWVTPFYDPTVFGCADCPANLNLVLVRSDPDVLVQYTQIVGQLTLLLVLVCVGDLLRRYAKGSAPVRRVLAPVALPATAFTGAYAGNLVVLEFVGRGPEAARYIDVLNLVLYVALALLPFGVALGLWLARRRRALVGDLVVEIGDLPTADRLEAALARALGDPSVQVGIWSAAAQSYVDASGEVLQAEGLPEGRASTFLARGHQPLAVIVHDEALLEDPGLLAAVSAAARLAVENERLQEEVLEQLAEVHASRARIVEAADEARRRIERDLHDGAQQRLVSLSLALRMAEARLDPADAAQARQSLASAAEELQLAIRELRELARGIHPAVLTDEGLAPALESLALRSAVPVQLEQLVEQRLPAAVEATAYFVVSEALTNVSKYAAASGAVVRSWLDDDELVVEVADDGVGGAAAESGSGLRGLTDRVQALGGTLEVHSPAGQGTRLVGRIPLAGARCA